MGDALLARTARLAIVAALPALGGCVSGPGPHAAAVQAPPAAVGTDMASRYAARDDGGFVVPGERHDRSALLPGLPQDGRDPGQAAHRLETGAPSIPDDLRVRRR